MKLRLSSFLIMIFSIVISQERTVITLLPFQSADPNFQNEAIIIYDKVRQSFITAKRFEIVERSEINKIELEREVQKNESFINNNIVAQGNMMAAEQIVTGHLNNVAYSKVVDEKTGSYYYKCKISFTINVLDVETGMVLHSKTISPTESFASGLLTRGITGVSTPSDALKNTLSRTDKYINEFILEYFPLKTEIIKIVEVKKDEAKSLLLNVGSFQGTKKNSEFNVYEISSVEVNGRNITREVLIGKVKIKEVQGEEISLAEVKKGGVEILSKFSANTQLVCKATL